jgi:uncharacterized ParB-like nuclease family protein
VGPRTIRAVDYRRVLAGVESDRRAPIDAEVRRRVLDRMIDEELLVQRALELGLATVDRRIRGELTSALMDSIVAEADAEGMTEADLRAHFEANVDFFSRPGRIHGRTIFFAEGGAHRRPPAERAARALERLRVGDDPGAVATELGDPQVSPLPDGLLPPGKVRDYVGPGVLQVLESLEVGDWSEPVEMGRGLVVAGLVAREPRIVPRFEDVRPFVEQDLRRRRGDEALRRYLDDLRAEADITIDETALDGASRLEMAD